MKFIFGIKLFRQGGGMYHFTIRADTTKIKAHLLHHFALVLVSA